MDNLSTNPSEPKKNDVNQVMGNKNPKSHFRRRDMDFVFLFEDLDQNVQVHIFNFDRHLQENPIHPHGQKINHPDKDREWGFPERKERGIPPVKEPKEDNDTEDDIIIEDPTRELDGLYKPGHADRDNSPPIEEDV